MSVSDGPPYGPTVNGTQIVFFEYKPNRGAAWAFVVMFAIAVIGHLIYLFWLRAWHFIPLILGGIGEAFGYYGRAWASDNPNEAGPFILQNLLILGSTPLIAATLYMSLGRLINSLDLRHRSCMSPAWMAFFYMVVDVGCFVTQVFGSVTPASGDPAGVELGQRMIIGGLIAQLAALALFILSTFLTHRWATTESARRILKYRAIGWKNYFFVTYAVTLTMIVRSLVRGIEFIQGDGGTIITHEAFIYIFDGLPMLSVLASYLWCHPGMLMRDANQFDKRMSVTSADQIMLEHRLE